MKARIAAWSGQMLLMAAVGCSDTTTGASALGGTGTAGGMDGSGRPGASSGNGGLTTAGSGNGGTGGTNPSGNAGASSGGSAGTSSGGSAGTSSGGNAGVSSGGNAGASSGGNAGASSGGSGGSAGTSACPLDLVGFATLEGGTTGGGNTPPTTVTSQAELRACATAAEPRVCRVQGTVTFSPFEEIRVASDKTIIGAGATAEIVMGGFFLASGVHNVIIRNLTIRDSHMEGDDGGDRDGVQLDTAHHVWIDHNRFSNLGDGQIDSRKDTTLETVSWNILENHNKAFGIGWTANVTAQMTIHHNWIRNTVQRNPSTDNVLRAHLFNNLLEKVSSYGNYSRGGTNMVLENSVFVGVKDPHYYDTGTLVATGNLYENTTGQKEVSGTTFSFFDPSKLYPYRLDAASNVKSILARCAGPRAELGN